MTPLSEPLAASTPVVRHAARQVFTAPTWRSGVFAGYSPAADESFARWRGAAIQTATDYMSSVTWTQIADPVRTLSAWRDAPQLQLVLSVPMWPLQGGDLTLAASGAYDKYFARLAKSLVSAGRADTILRIGWEFNTPYFRWSVSNPSQAAEYAAAWRHIVMAMRSGAGQHFSFVWNPDLTDHGINPAAAYPGDGYVTDIGLDIYDRDEIAGQTAPQRWSSLVNETYGLTWQSRFAAAHGKPLAFPEWGLVNDPHRATAVGGDDPTFIRNMFDWFATHNTAFEDYFDSDPPAGHGSFAISTRGAFPRAATAYRQLFAGRTAS